ncbi:MAG TPA: EAL domain-containing protein [Gemmatimonadaceae bacterium]|nr:EAL domain-containing protein [Gemmatimonadaceae bacterium]
MAERQPQVLLIDDSAQDAELIARELRKSFGGAQIERVDTPSALKAALQLARWDVVLSDNRMPAFSGMEALHLVKATAPDLPFILVTGTMGEEAAVEALKAGVDDYVLKSNLPHLKEVFERQLREADQRRERRHSLDALQESEQRFRQLAENIDALFYLTDLENRRLFYASPAYEKIWGRSLESLYADPRSWYAAVHPDDRAQTVRQVERAAAGPTETGYRIIRADGAVRWLRSRRFPVRDSSGNPYRIAGIIEDITERREAEERIARLNRMREVMSGIDALIVRVRDREELYREACRIAVEVGQMRMAWIGMHDRKANSVVPVAWHGGEESFLRLITMAIQAPMPEGKGLGRRAIREGRAVVINDMEHDTTSLLRAEALKRGYRSAAALPLAVGAEVYGVLGLFAAEPGFFDEDEMRLLTELAGDVSFALDHIEKSERLNYLALYDSLTGLANRTLFHERLAEHVRVAERTGDRFAVCVFDVERIKTINDTLGRQAGDALLAQIAERMRQAAADEGAVARVSGDGFAFLVSGVKTDDDAARQLEGRLRACFGSSFMIGEQALAVSARAGVALFPNDGRKEDVLFANAEAACIRAKETGERYLFYTRQMTETVAENLRLENKLRRALEHDEFVLHYQPKVNAQTRRIEGAEALIRWQSPELGLVPPMQFIPLMEETGLILEAGAWALRQAVADHHAWVRSGLPAIRIAVNVSALQLRQRDFVEQVQSALADEGRPPAIDLELTESLLMKDIDRNVETLAALRALGMRVAIDDFGTGHSSLSYLARLPVDTLKIDRSFIITMLKDSASMTLVRTIIALAHSLKLDVVAEGVDSEEQAQVLCQLECDQMQGYLVSRPLPRNEFGALLASYPDATS